MVNAPVILTEPTAAAESPAAEPPEPQPEVVAESGKTIVEPRLDRGSGQTQHRCVFPILIMLISNTFSHISVFNMFFSLQLFSLPVYFL